MGFDSLTRTRFADLPDHFRRLTSGWMIDGVNSTWIYVGAMYSGALIHDEDLGLGSFSVMAAGTGAKIWWIFAPRHWDRITAWLGSECEFNEVAPTLFFSTVVPPAGSLTVGVGF